MMMRARVRCGTVLLILLAEALEALYPGVKFWVGPPIENGFYYDVDFGDQSITDKDFARSNPR
jgi:threonyl-tRNA synthetase